jgi:transitional endoplasmic reticulum ATPase
MNDPNAMAIEALRQAVKLAPENIELACHLGNMLLSLNRHDEAVSLYQESLAANPGNVPLQLGLAESFCKLGRVSHALAITESLIAKYKNNAKALLLHARILNLQGDTSSATVAYRDAIDQSPELADKAFESLIGYSDFASNEEEEQRPLRMGWDAAEEVEKEFDVELERPTLKFENVGGMSSVKEDIRLKIIYPLQHAEMYAAYGKKIGGGILMYGPPGCGKTLLARATAGEVNSTFISVGINDVLDMWIGSSEKNLHGLFEQARRHKPCVLFFDEVDALGASRADMRRTGGRHLINQFLSELDGVSADNEGLLFLAATNAPWHLDSAFRRPGRFDRILFVPPPDEAARVEILRIALGNKPQDSVDAKKVAQKLKDYSGADLAAIVEMAVEMKLQEAIKTGLPKPITTNDLLAASKQVKASTGEWFATARNHALFSNEGGAYDPILEYLGLKR